MLETLSSNRPMSEMSRVSDETDGLAAAPDSSPRGDPGVPACRSGATRADLEQRARAAQGSAVGGQACWAGTVPSRPAWKSSNAWRSSASVFMTNGPYHATGSRIGAPAEHQHVQRGRVAVLGRRRPARSAVSPAPSTASWPLRSGRRSAPTVPAPPSDVDQRVEVRPPRQRQPRRRAETVAWTSVIGV